jgi:hypothetical protein
MGSKSENDERNYSGADYGGLSPGLLSKHPANKLVSILDVPKQAFC